MDHFWRQREWPKWKVKRGKPYGGKRQALTQDELDRLFAALKGNRHGHRDYMIALVTFLHGLRVSELIDLRWDDIDWRKGTIAIRRLKGSIDGTHYLERDEDVSRRGEPYVPWTPDLLGCPEGDKVLSSSGSGSIFG